MNESNEPNLTTDEGELLPGFMVSCDMATGQDFSVCYEVEDGKIKRMIPIERQSGGEWVPQGDAGDEQPR